MWGLLVAGARRLAHGVAWSNTCAWLAKVRSTQAGLLVASLTRRSFAKRAWLCNDLAQMNIGLFFCILLEQAKSMWPRRASPAKQYLEDGPLDLLTINLGGDLTDRTYIRAYIRHPWENAI